eukprot:4357859-Amphidinium_carterae.1
MHQECRVKVAYYEEYNLVRRRKPRTQHKESINERKSWDKGGCNCGKSLGYIVWSAQGNCSVTRRAMCRPSWRSMLA